MFITFEGLDYSGKTTQAKMLLAKLKQAKKSVEYYREPGSTWLSDRIRETVLDTRHLLELKQSEISHIAEMFLFSAARVQLVKERLFEDLDAGKIVICDRFYDSTTAYQGYGRGIDLASIRQVNEISTLGIKPDLTFLVDIPVEEVLHRKTFDDLFHDRIENQVVNFFQRVRDGYLILASEEPERFCVLDGLKSIAEIHSQIWREVQERIKRRVKKTPALPELIANED